MNTRLTCCDNICASVVQSCNWSMARTCHVYTFVSTLHCCGGPQSCSWDCIGSFVCLRSNKPHICMSRWHGLYTNISIFSLDFHVIKLLAQLKWSQKGDRDPAIAAVCPLVYKVVNMVRLFELKLITSNCEIIKTECMKTKWRKMHAHTVDVNVAFKCSWQSHKTV